MRGPLSKCESPAHFFNFIEPGLKSQLSIPVSFRKYIKSKRDNETAILKRGCQKWCVKVIDWTFSEGWDNFVRDNGVEDFDFVVFKHEGNMVFNTMVFDTSWCEREYSNNQVTESSRTCIIDTDAPKNIPKEEDIGPDHIYHPYFIGTLGTTACEYGLYLPINFTRSTRLRAREMILRNGQRNMSWTVKLKTCLKRSTTVKLKTCLKRYIHIGQGWHDFYTANGLKEGDQFKFELIQTGIKPIAIFYRLKTLPSSNPESLVILLKDYC
ncbi:hypothetical protein M8C21_022237 [Ambrosia artemisiifolia]|uniref:TF-B3 domain-containing protein n=1 Tax=Ambrosia artemisiifolia TaxID=4212 RepID=A0AAD5D7Z3_AMBAR|nr:hypothetical protein M8C21_022237 [Ambrosia artemisiifolia]